jgi:hypothetical protein
MDTNWNNCSDPQAFKDIAIFSADFYGHTFWSANGDVLNFCVSFNDHFGPAAFSFEIAPEYAKELRILIEKYGHGKENYEAVANWLIEKNFLK